MGLNDGLVAEWQILELGSKSNLDSNAALLVDDRVILSRSWSYSLSEPQFPHLGKMKNLNTLTKLV